MLIRYPLRSSLSSVFLDIFGSFSEVSGQVQHNLFEKNLFFENLGEEFSEFGGVGLDTLWDVGVVGKD